MAPERSAVGVILADGLGLPLLLADGGIGVIVMLALSVALSAASFFLAGSQRGPRVRPNFTPTTLATQGAVIPWLVGRRRIGCILAWAGSRFVRSEPVGGSGGGGLFGKGSKRKGGGGQSQTVYYESGWHLLCVGPATALYRIWQEGKIIWEGSINSTDDPSGSSFAANDGSTFTIYWGEASQPVNTYLADAARVGWASRWPSVCYVLWEGKRLGQSPRWPQIEYDLEMVPHFEVLTAAPFSLAEASLPLSPPIVTTTADYSGPNPAYVIAQLLFETYPHGLGLDTDHFLIGERVQDEGGDFGPFEGPAGSIAELAGLLAAEELVISVIASDGEEADATLARIMQDVGVLWFRSTLTGTDGGRGAWYLVRDEAPSTIAPEALLPTECPTEILHVERGVDRASFSFADVDRAFHDTVISVDEDGQASFTGNVRARKINLETVVHFLVASMVAERRSQEELAGGARFTIYAGRNTRDLVPGQAVSHPDIPVALRVTDVRMSDESPRVELELIQDHYGAVVSIHEHTAEPTSEGDTAPATDNIEATFVEVPAFLLDPGAGGMALLPLRIRGDQRMQLQVVYLSPDGTSYIETNRDAEVMTGGVLTEAIDADALWSLEDGPTFDVEGDDLGDVVEDYSSDASSWLIGRQLALIGEELFHLRNVTALGGGSYRMHGLRRARYDTERAAHAPSDPVFIFSFAAVDPVFDLLLAPGVSVRMKQQAVGGGPGAVDLTGITATVKTLTGKGVVPMRPGGLRMLAPVVGSWSFATGDDITFRWHYRGVSPANSGAGMQGAGAACGDVLLAGEFEVRLLTTGDVLKQTITQTATSYTLTNANLLTWFGSEQSVKVEVRHVNGGFRSTAVTNTAVFA